jgi:hypothetical protein
MGKPRMIGDEDKNVRRRISDEMMNVTRQGLKRYVKVMGIGRAAAKRRQGYLVL